MQHDKLLLKMPKYNAFYCGGCSRDGVGTKEASDDTEHETTDATKPVATAASLPAAPQLSAKYVSMPLLVRPELS